MRYKSNTKVMIRAKFLLLIQIYKREEKNFLKERLYYLETERGYYNRQYFQSIVDLAKDIGISDKAVMDLKQIERIHISLHLLFAFS